MSLNVGPGGGILPAMDGRTKVEFPPGALTKPTTVMIQSFKISPNSCPAGFTAGPILTLEPRRRRFHQNVNYYIPTPSELDRDLYDCHILCSITEGTAPAEWKDVTNSVEIIWTADAVAKFSGNVSGRFWIIFTRKTRDKCPQGELQKWRTCAFAKVKAEVFRRKNIKVCKFKIL